MQPITIFALEVPTGLGEAQGIVFNSIIRETNAIAFSLPKEGLHTHGVDYNKQKNKEYFISMPELPFSIPLSPEAFQSHPELRHVQRRLSDLVDHFADHSASNAILENSNPLVYEYWEREYEGASQGISFGMTRIHPGRVGNEYYLTKGHFHADDFGDEIHITLSGQGLLLLFSEDGVCQTFEMLAGKMNYLPGNLAHRTINTGSEPLVFVGFWPPKIIHDYETILHNGFPKLVITGLKGPELINNPNFKI